MQLALLSAITLPVALQLFCFFLKETFSTLIFSVKMNLSLHLTWSCFLQHSQLPSHFTPTCFYGQALCDLSKRNSVSCLLGMGYYDSAILMNQPMTILSMPTLKKLPCSPTQSNYQQGMLHGTNSLLDHAQEQPGRALLSSGQRHARILVPHSSKTSPITIPGPLTLICSSTWTD